MSRPIPPRQIQNPDEIFTRLKDATFSLKDHPTGKDIMREMAEALGLPELSQDIMEHVEEIVTCYSFIENYHGEGKRLTDGVTIGQTVAAIDFLLKAQDRYGKTLKHSASAVMRRWPKAKDRYIRALQPFASLMSTIESDTVKILMPFANECLATTKDSGDDLPVRMQQLAVAAEDRRHALLSIERVVPEVEHARCVACFSKLVFDKFADQSVCSDNRKLHKFVIASLRTANISHDDYSEHAARLIELLENCENFIAPFKI